MKKGAPGVRSGAEGTREAGRIMAADRHAGALRRKDAKKAAGNPAA